jgi:hypothetical protein
MNNALLVEAAKVVKAFGPVDTTGAGQDGAWVSLKDYRRLAVVLSTGAWAGGNAAVTLEQAQDAAGTGAKALAFDKYVEVFNNASTPKDAASEVAVSNNTYNLTGANKVHVIEVRTGDLDINNGFKFVRVRTASPGANADLIAAHYLLYKGGHVAKPANLPSVLS